MNTCSLEAARFKAEIATLNAEFARYEGVELITNVSEEDLKAKVTSCERSMASIGTVNMRALEIYEVAEKEFNNLIEKKGVLLNEKGDVVNLMNEIEANKKEYSHLL